jgi:hypothetical protein
VKVPNFEMRFQGVDAPIKGESYVYQAMLKTGTTDELAALLPAPSANRVTALTVSAWRQ